MLDIHPLPAAAALVFTPEFHYYDDCYLLESVPLCVPLHVPLHVLNFSLPDSCCHTNRIQVIMIDLGPSYDVVAAQQLSNLSD